MQPDQIHVDVESLSTKRRAQLLSIGAAFCDAEFYIEIDTSLYPQDGTFITDEATLKWWADRGGFTPSTDPVSPLAAVSAFSHWARRMTEGLEWFEVWANSPSFDCEKLRYHYDQFNLTTPWEFWQERCVRTVKNLGKSLHLNVPEVKTVAHHALADARDQQRTVDSVITTLAQKVQLANDRADDRDLDLNDLE